MNFYSDSLFSNTEISSYQYNILQPKPDDSSYLNMTKSHEPFISFLQNNNSQEASNNNPATLKKVQDMNTETSISESYINYQTSSASNHSQENFCNGLLLSSSDLLNDTNTYSQDNFESFIIPATNEIINDKRIHPSEITDSYRTSIEELSHTKEDYNANYFNAPNKEATKSKLLNPKLPNYSHNYSEDINANTSFNNNHLYTSTDVQKSNKNNVPTVACENCGHHNNFQYKIVPISQEEPNSIRMTSYQTFNHSNDAFSGYVQENNSQSSQSNSFSQNENSFPHQSSQNCLSNNVEEQSQNLNKKQCLSNTENLEILSDITNEHQVGNSYSTFGHSVHKQISEDKKQRGESSIGSGKDLEIKLPTMTVDIEKWLEYLLVDDEQVKQDQEKKKTRRKKNLSDTDFNLFFGQPLEKVNSKNEDVQPASSKVSDNCFNVF